MMKYAWVLLVAFVCAGALDIPIPGLHSDESKKEVCADNTVCYFAPTVCLLNAR